MNWGAMQGQGQRAAGWGGPFLAGIGSPLGPPALLPLLPSRAPGAAEWGGGSQGLHMPLSDLGFHRVERRGGGLGKHDTRGPVSSKLSSLLERGIGAPSSPAPPCAPRALGNQKEVLGPLSLFSSQMGKLRPREGRGQPVCAPLWPHMCV